MKKEQSWKFLTSGKFFCCTSCDGPWCIECGEGLSEYEYINLDGVCSLCLEDYEDEE